MAGRDMAEDDIVTIRDIYNSVQKLNTRVAEMVQQISTIAERAAEDRRQAEELADEMGKLKTRVYGLIVAITLASTLVMTFTQLGGNNP
jgi:tetrahydromethanopterin S-methyltransferase subunit B